MSLTSQQVPSGKSYTRVAAAIIIAAVVVAASILVPPILQPAGKVTTTVTQEEPCGSGQLVWNSSSTLGVTYPLRVPVLLMQPSSTAFVCVTYQSSWKGNVTQFPGYGSPDVNHSQFIAGFSLVVYKYLPSISQPIFSHNFITSADPSSIHFGDTTNYVDIFYTITALDNSTGFYDHSAQYACDTGMPLAVGYQASQVNASDFSPISIGHFYCGPLLYFQPVSISIVGMNYTIISIPSA
jgi:hypothetical protein